MKKQTLIGMIIGIVLPIICAAGYFYYTSLGRNISVIDCFKAYKLMSALMFKILSFSLMPNAALFFLLVNKNYDDLAKGLLGITICYGVVVLLLYCV
ncbi:MAG: hypothetical protein MJ069_01165 [Salinivirgaceae bacterium]|nr:hypothetical protein [Salinivirgaceae bacterium]